MHDTGLGAILWQMRNLVAAEQAETLTDAELLRHFVERRDERAFAALLQRHGPMVLGVCRRLLPNQQDVEDAFQATFLVFVRKAGSIRARQSVGSWLHGAAARAAAQARRAAARRREHETRAAAMARSPSCSELHWAEVQVLVHEELARLPEKYRAPFTLCCLEGESIASAARRLGWKEGTVAGRLARARERLRVRLAERGVCLSALLCALALAEGARAAVPAALAATTAGAGLALAAGESAAAAGASPDAIALMEGVCRTMTGTKLKSVAALLLVLGLAATGTGLLAGVLTQKPAPVNRAEEPADPGRAPAEETLTVTGQVVGADGKPVKNAAVALLRWDSDRGTPEAVGSARTDGDGKFALTTRRPGAATFRNQHRLAAVAAAPGHGLVWQPLDAEAGRREVRLRLAVEQAVRGRIVDLQGKAAAGVRVHVMRVGKAGAEPVLVEFAQPPQDLGAWPASAVTDEEGGFTLRGLGADLATVRVTVFDDRFSRHTLDFRPREKEELRVVAEPARILEGIVTRDDTKKPVKGARVVVHSLNRRAGFVETEHGHTVTDEQGRYRLHAPLGVESTFVNAWAPTSDPALGSRVWVNWPRGAVKHTADLALPAGTVVRGKVTEAGTGKPVAGATLHYYPFDDQAESPAYKRERGRGGYLTVQTATSGPDGTFQFALPPGVAAHLAVLGPTRDYIEEVTACGKVTQRQERAQRFYCHALVPLELDALKPGAKVDLAVKLRRGVTVKGRVVGPDGKPAAGVLMISSMSFRASPFMWRGEPVLLRGSEFEFHGCDPEQTSRVHFLDVANKFGAVAEVSPPKAGREPVTVRLAPCGTAVVSVRDFLDRPVRLGRRYCGPHLMITPGSFRLGDRDEKVFAQGGLYAEEIELRRYLRGVETEEFDDQGRITCHYLIPGATYHLWWWVDRKGGRHREFKVKPGEALKLPDIVYAEGEVP